MSCLKAPLFSLTAHGSFAGLLNYAGTTRPTLRKHPSRSTRHRSAQQISQTSRLLWLTRRWARLSSADQTSWTSVAEALDLSPYHAFVRANLARFKTGDFPISNVNDEPGNKVHEIDFPKFYDNSGRATFAVMRLETYPMIAAVVYHSQDPEGMLVPKKIFRIFNTPTRWSSLVVPGQHAPGRWYIRIRGFLANGTPTHASTWAVRYFP